MRFSHKTVIITGFHDRISPLELFYIYNSSWGGFLAYGLNFNDERLKRKKPFVLNKLNLNYNMGISI